jgi:hypothetical protein
MGNTHPRPSQTLGKWGAIILHPQYHDLEIGGTEMNAEWGLTFIP